MLHDYTDDELIQCVTGSDSWRKDEAFTVIVHKYTGYVIRAARTILHRDQDIAEVVQESFLKALLSMHTFRRRSALSTWLYHIARNTAINRARKGYIRHEIPIDQYSLELYPTYDTVSYMESREQLRWLLAVTARLPEPKSIVWEMYEFNGMTYAEIAHALKIPHGTVESRLRYVRKNLKRAIEDQTAPT